MAVRHVRLSSHSIRWTLPGSLPSPPTPDARSIGRVMSLRRTSSRPSKEYSDLRPSVSSILRAISPRIASDGFSAPTSVSSGWAFASLIAFFRCSRASSRFPHIE